MSFFSRQAHHCGDFIHTACIRPITIHLLTDSTSLHGSIPVISTTRKSSGYTMVHTVRHYPRAPKWWSGTDLLETVMLENKLGIRNPRKQAGPSFLYCISDCASKRKKLGVKFLVVLFSCTEHFCAQARQTR